MTGTPKILDSVGSISEALVGLDLADAISLGKAQNWVDFIAAGEATISSGIERELWDGPTLFSANPGVAGLLNAVSDDINDDEGGTGAEKILVTYIDADGWERIGIATMDGTNSVPVIQVDNTFTPLPGTPQATALRVLRVIVIQCNAGANDTLVPVGNISVDIAGAVASYTNAGMGQARSSCYRIPRGKWGFISRFGGDTDSNSSIRFRARLKIKGLPPRIPYTFHSSEDGIASFELFDKVALPPETDLCLTASFTAGGTAVATSLFRMKVGVIDSLDPDPNPNWQPPRFS